MLNTPLFALAAPLALLLVWFGSLHASGARPRRLIKSSALATWLGVLISGVAIWLVSTQGILTSQVWGAAGLGASLRLDPLSVAILCMVALLAVPIVRFSATYLDGDARQGTFIGRMCLTIATVEVLIISDNLALFTAAWIATSLSLHTLLVFYRDRPRARLAAKKKVIVSRLGDLCLIGAAALVYSHFGTGEFGEIFARAATTEVGAALEVAAALLAMCAALKSAQFPTHGWLVEVMETPTPVSALLHAGLLNAGPYLVMRFAAVMEVSTAASILLVCVGGCTALFASSAVLTQPTIKITLGYSSAAHMGFMLMVCGLGVYPAAVLHLIAHSFYKAHAFLSSGSVVDEARAARVRLSRRLHHPPRQLLSLLMALGIWAGLAALLGIDPSTNPALLAIGAILVMGLTQLLAPALDTKGGGAATIGRTAAYATGVGLAFFGLEEGTRLLLGDALPALAPPDPIVIVLSVLVLCAFSAAIALQVIGLPTDAPWARALRIHLRNGLYANAAFDRLIGALRR